MASLQDQGTPTIDLEQLLDHGRTSLRQRRWRDARRAFEQVIDASPSVSEAWEGLASAALFLEDAAASRNAAERAYRQYIDQGDPKGAARVAVQLAVYHDTYRGEQAIANGWFERARSLLASVPPSAEHAWLAFWRAHIDIHIHAEVAKGEPSLEHAIRLSEAARIGGELALMTRGLRGLLAISEGAIDEGLRCLDETTTAVMARELPAPQIAGWTYCYVLDACENVRDIDRAAQWIGRAFELEDELNIRHYMGACREHYIGILTWRADYAAAEREIETMRREVADVGASFITRSDIRLGEVRRRQGRLEEAAALLEPVAAQPQALLALAWLALDRDEPEQAEELVDRYLRRVSGTDRIRRLHALDIGIRACIARGRTEPARTALDECLAVVERSGTPLMRAGVRELQGRALAATGALDDARRHLEDAVDGYDLARAPYEATTARLALGEVLASLGREDAARRTLDGALTGARRIGAGRLERLATGALDKVHRVEQSDAAAAGNGGARPRGRADGRVASVLTPREIEVLALVAQGLSNQDIGEKLFVSAFTVKRHIANILTKLDLPTRAAAAAYAIREGLAL